ncbi:hypothetical protein ACROYT_G006785 [Oculina patagonica]
MSNITGSARSPIAVSLEPTDTWYWAIRGIIAILTITGNGLVIYFITFKRRLRVINNWFVLSLAISDFCVGLFTTPTGLACTFQFRCDWRIQITFYNFLLFASTLNLWVMTVDRYIGIVHSLRYTSLITTTRVILMVAMSWGIAFFTAFVRLLWLYDTHLRKTIERYYRVSIDIFFGVFSCVVLVAVYVRILYVSRKLSRQSALQVSQVNYNHAQKCYRQQRRHSSARVLGSVVLLFVLCYSTSIYVSFCLNFRLGPVNPLVGSISLLMIHCNSAVNFVVYAFMKKDIRLELRRLCRCGNPLELNTTASREFSLS